MNQQIYVAIAGALGKMGSMMLRGIPKMGDMQVVGAADPLAQAKEIEVGGNRIPIETDLDKSFDRLERLPDVVVDFTRPDAAGPNAITALERGIRPVVGTTGIEPESVSRIRQLCEERALGACLIPNFSIGVLALARASKEAARWLKKAEIVEMHHDEKLDAPSGTAKQLAEGLGAILKAPVPIHSVRLPGLVAHHEIVFGEMGQWLTLRHDTANRDAFLPGITAAIRKVLQIRGIMLTSLDQVLDD